MKSFDANILTKELQIDAKALGIPSGAADVFIKRTVSAAKNSFKTKSIITSQDLTKAIAKELKKYHADLAYVYENRDKII